MYGASFNTYITLRKTKFSVFFFSIITIYYHGKFCFNKIRLFKLCFLIVHESKE